MRSADPRKTCEDPRGTGRDTRPIGGAAKRVLDVVLALAALAILAPLLAVVAVMVLANGGRPILTGDKLVGFRGRAFNGYRFRARQGTRIAAVLERSGVAELPRLLNVLAGSMSFVGPRPARAEARIHRGSHPALLVARPGLTGTWDGQHQAAMDPGVESSANGAEARASRWSLLRDLAGLVNGSRATLRRRPREGRGTPRASDARSSDRAPFPRET